MKNNFEKEILIMINERISDMLDDISRDLQENTSYLICNKYANKYLAQFKIDVWESMKVHCQEFYQKLEALEKWGENE